MLSTTEFLHIPPLEQTLLGRAYETLQKNIYDPRGYPWSPYRLVSPGRPRFPGVWNWDTAFHSYGIARWDPQLAREGILGFLQFQGENGLLPDVVFEDGRVATTYSKPPVFAWAAWRVYQREPDRSFLEQVYPALVKNAAFWERERCDRGLFYYDSADRDGPEYEKHIRYESGWDNSVRWDCFIGDQWPVDLNCFMVMTYNALAFMARELGQADAPWQEKGEALAERILRTMWDGRAFVDVNRITGAYSTVLTPASFMPLYVKIATREQAQKMAHLAADPQKFNSHMPTVAYDDPGYQLEYWRGPVWLNVAWFAAKGLQNYGFAVADTIRQNILEMVAAEPRGIFENYDSRTKRGLDKKNRIRCDGFSWSCIFIIEFILGWKEETK